MKFVFILIFFIISRIFADYDKVSFYELWEEQNYSEILRIIKTENPSNFFLTGLILSKTGLFADAVSNILLCTNDTLLRDYAFLRAGEILCSNGLEKGFTFLKKLESSTNFVIKYRCYKSQSEFLYSKKNYSDAIKTFQNGINSLPEKNQNLLVNLLGRNYLTTLLMGQFKCMNIIKNSSLITVATKIIKVTKPSRYNKWLLPVLTYLTNEELQDWSSCFYLAKHLISFGYKGEKTKSLLEKACDSALNLSQFFQAWEELYGLVEETNIKRLDKYTEKIRKKAAGTKFEENLLYYDALRFHNNKKTEYAFKLFMSLLTNSIKNSAIEMRTVSFLIERTNIYPLSLSDLFKISLSYLKEDPDWSELWFKWTLKNIFLKKDWKSSLSIFTNLNTSAPVCYFTGLCFLNLKDDTSACEWFRKVIRLNSSRYYTVKALERIKDIYKSNHSLKKQSLIESKRLFLSFMPGRWPSSYESEKLLNILSLDPDFRLDYKKTDELLKISLSKGTTNNKILYQYIKRFFILGLFEEGKIEFLLNEPFDINSVMDFSDFFYRLKIPSLNFRTAETSYRLFGGALPYFIFKHPIAKNAFPYWYADKIPFDSKDKSLYLAIIREESAFKFDAISSAGASGLMQLMPQTYNLMMNTQESSNDFISIFKPSYNIKSGVKFFNDLLKKFNSLPKAIAAYNAGPVIVEKWITQLNNPDDEVFVELIPYEETREYVKKIIFSYFCYNDFK